MSLQVKLCVGCDKVKELEGGFYKAGTSWQKRCKRCHNAKRLEYLNVSSYSPRLKGFQKLPEELRNKIIYDIYVRINFKDISNKYKDEYPQIKYQTLLMWNRKGLIPPYVETTC